MQESQRFDVKATKTGKRKSRGTLLKCVLYAGQNAFFVTFANHQIGCSRYEDRIFLYLSPPPLGIQPIQNGCRQAHHRKKYAVGKSYKH